MYSNLLIYRNELKIKSIQKYKLIGIVVELLFSKMVFPRNSEIVDFLNDVFSVEFKSYIIKSRTLIAAKLCRYIENEESITAFQKELYKFVCNKIEDLKDDAEAIKKKNTFDGWLD